MIFINGLFVRIKHGIDETIIAVVNIFEVSRRIQGMFG